MVEHIAESVHFSGLISELGPEKWQACAWIRGPDLSLRETIGPKTLATLPLAQDWLSQLASERGLKDFEIVVERLGGEGLLVETIKPGRIEENLTGVDVDA
jgi:hypothetical protein